MPSVTPKYTRILSIDRDGMEGWYQRHVVSKRQKEPHMKAMAVPILTIRLLGSPPNQARSRDSRASVSLWVSQGNHRSAAMRDVL